MRHNKKFNHLGRTASHRNAMLANMACSLIKHKRITTTVAKAKALKKYVEPLLTKSKNDTTNSRRVVFSYLQDKYAITELFKEISVKIADRPGGYTRIIKTGHRLGDNAEMCFIELVDYNENMAKDKAAKNVWVTMPRCASSNSLITTKTWLRTRLPRKLRVLVVPRRTLLLRLLLKLPLRLRLLRILRLKLLLNNKFALITIRGYIVGRCVPFLIFLPLELFSFPSVYKVQ